MIQNNIELLNDRIIETLNKCGRNIDTVRLVAVSKRFPTSSIKEAQEAGQRLFGENYIQEANDKYHELHGNVQFHFIGHLQSNKAKIAAEICSMIETVNSFKLAKKLNNHLVPLTKTLDILVQVNTGDDTNKSGIAPDKVGDLLRKISKLPMLRALGLMTIPPFTENPDNARSFFQELRLLSQSLSKEKLFFDNNRVELSMGMSNDYRIAIEEGATLVRIGTAIFGQRVATRQNQQI